MKEYFDVEKKMQFPIKTDVYFFDLFINLNDTLIEFQDGWVFT